MSDTNLYSAELLVEDYARTLKADSLPDLLLPEENMKMICIPAGVWREYKEQQKLDYSNLIEELTGDDELLIAKALEAHAIMKDAKKQRRIELRNTAIDDVHEYCNLSGAFVLRHHAMPANHRPYLPAMVIVCDVCYKVHRVFPTAMDSYEFAIHLGTKCRHCGGYLDLNSRIVETIPTAKLYPRNVIK
jgi:hypothetical protein